MKKRLFATLLALVMALGLTVTAAAEEPTNLNEWLGTATTNEVKVVFQYGIVNEEVTVAVTGYDLGNGSYKLGGNLTIDAPLIVTGTVTLDLNGHTLTYNGTAQNSVIVVKDSAHFTLMDSSSGGKITGGTGTKYTDAEDPDYNTVFGGGVFVGSQATFTMTGGSIEGCSATGALDSKNNVGGGVYLASALNADSRTTFNMTGGSIVECSSGYGGGVCARMCTNITISNSEISNCTAGGSGGGVYCIGSSSSLSVTNSTISDCKATTSGGGVNAGCTGGTFTMKDSSITDCTAQAGGGVYNYDGTFIMEAGSTISGCKAIFDSATIGAVFHGGGGVYIRAEVFTMEAGSTISGCTSSDGKSDSLSLGDPGFSESCNMNGTGGSVRGSVYNGQGNIKNTSTDGSTLFYGGITNGDNGKITGKRVTFKNGEATYAETVANNNGNGKISQPVAPTAPEGKAFAGWSYTKNDGSTGMWNFGSTFATNDPECQKESYISDKDITWDVATLTAVWEDIQPDEEPTASAHQPIRRQNTTAVEDTTDTAETTVVASPKTFDAGVALYGAMAALSLTGTAWVARKKKEF